MRFNGGRTQKQADTYTHLWRSRDGDFPVTPTGEEGPPVNGQAYAKVRTPDGHESYVPRGELILRPIKSAKKAAPPLGLSPAEEERLRTWMFDIADQMLGDKHEEIDGSCRFGASRSLVVHPGGLFHNFVTGKGGVGGIALLMALHDVNADGAVQWAKAWLDNHSGAGGLADNVEQETRAAEDAEHIAFITETWARTVELKNTAGWAYLASRGLTPSDEDVRHIRWLPHARGIGAGAEGAMVVALTNNSDGLEALQLTYITVDGAKSATQPCRRTYRGAHGWGTRGLLRLGAAGEPKAYIVEGTEDGLALRQAGAERVLVLCGLSRLGKVILPF
jgi:hypothetical protein